MPYREKEGLYQDYFLGDWIIDRIQDMSKDGKKRNSISTRLSASPFLEMLDKYFSEIIFLTDA